MPLAIIILLLWAHAFYYNYATDDAFITFRYVHNMIEGKGLVYNPGERVEGYTNFLWAMLLALPASLGLEIETAAKLLGLAFGAATVIVVTRIASVWIGNRFSGGCRMLPLLPGALLAASGPFAMWTLGGLETLFFTFLLSVATLIYLQAANSRGSYSVGILLGLLTMTRPDGILFLFAILLHAAAGAGQKSENGPLERRILLIWRISAAFAVIYLPYFIWRYMYYGYLLPNTFYAKVGGGADVSGRGLKYVWLFFSTYGFVPLAAAAAFFYARMQKQPQPVEKDKKFVSLLVLQIAVYLLFIIGVGGDQLVMKRFFVPLLPALYLLTFRGVSESFIDMPAGEKARAGKPWFAAGIAVALFLVLAPSFAGREHDRVFKAEKPADSDRKLVGSWLRESLDKDAVIALIPAGIVPFYSGLTTIDLVGLNDAHIAHTAVPDFGKGEAGHERYNSAYVLQRRPDLVFLGAVRIWPDKVKPDVLLNYYWMYGKLAPGNREMLQLEEFKKNYAPAAARVDSGYVHFFKRNDFFFPLAEPLVAATVTG